MIIISQAPDTLHPLAHLFTFTLTHHRSPPVRILKTLLLPFPGAPATKINRVLIARRKAHGLAPLFHLRVCAL